MAQQRGISLLRQAQDRVWVNNRGEGFRLRIEAKNAVDMPAAIFLHQRSLIDPKTGEEADEFVCICSCFDLTTYPASEPNPTQFPQFFRKDYLDIILASQDMAEEAWTAIYAEVCMLVHSLNKLDYLSLGEEVRCGEPVEEPPDSVSETISVSDSVSESASV